MNRTMLIAMIAACTSSTAIAQQRSDENRQAVRKMFPIISLFDKKTKTADVKDDGGADTADRGGTEAGVAQGQYGRPRAGDPYGQSQAMTARLRAADIAGVRLEMTPAMARAALRASGYVPTPNRAYTDNRATVSETYDYATRVDNKRRERLRDFSSASRKITNAVREEEWNKGDERVAVSYSQMREGPRVAYVAYRIPEGRIGWDAMKSSILGKYGRPTRISDNNATVAYCGDGACAFLMNGQHATLELTGRWTLALSDGGAAERLADVQIAQDAERGIAKTAKPGF